jgi:hypothetical protein
VPESSRGPETASGRVDRPAAAIGELARKVAASPADIREAELKPLRDLGLSGVDIFDVVLAAAARCIFSSVLEATGRCQIRRTHTWMSRCARYSPLAARSRDVAQESAAAPRANP